MHTKTFDFNEKKVAILGWGMNGFDVYEYLSYKGAKITIFDRKEYNELDLSEVDSKKVNILTGKDYLKYGLNDFDFIFGAPGVYRYIPELIEADKNGVEITSAVKMFFDLCPAKIIGGTGTKGKGTTSTLIHQIIKKAGKDVNLAGNIGIPMLSLLSKLTKKSWVVLELSSFQLIDLTKSPHVAVVLNITEDHMDWHKDRQEYINAKKNIVKFQKTGLGLAIVKHLVKAHGWDMKIDSVPGKGTKVRIVVS